MVMLERLGLERELSDLGLREAILLPEEVEGETEDYFEGLTPSEMKAVRLTSTLETGSAGSFDGLTGDFDGYGISYGLLNWNIGAGSLQPLLLAFLQRHPDRWAAIFGPDADRFAAVLRTRLPKGGFDLPGQLAFVRANISHKTREVRQPWKGYFTTLAKEPGFRRIQVEKVRDRLRRALFWTAYFGLKSERGLVFMFDMVASHGGSWLHGKTSSNRRFDRRPPLREALARKKAEVGRDTLTEVEKMYVIGTVVGRTSSSKWAKKAGARKQWIAVGRHEYPEIEKPPSDATIHGHRLSKFDITDAPFTTSVSASAPAPSSAVLPVPGAPAPAPAANDQPAPDDGGWFGGIYGQMRDYAVVELARKRLGSNANEITDEVFYARHPERNRKPIQQHEEREKQEWRAIREQVVKPVLAKAAAASAAAPTRPIGAPSSSNGASSAAFIEATHPAVVAAIAKVGNDPNAAASEAFYAIHRGGVRTPIAKGDEASERLFWSLREGPVALALALRGAKTSRDELVSAGAQLASFAVVARHGLNPSKNGRGTVGGKAVVPSYVVVHTTGGGPARKARESNRTALDRALALYTARGSEGYPHYLIHYDGTAIAVYDERWQAPHAGYAPELARTPIPAWWRAAWGPRGLEHPRELHPRGGGSPNRASIGIELLADPTGYGFTEPQYIGLARLVKDIARRHGIALTEPPASVLLGHEDVAPWTRTRPNGQPWDPGGQSTPQHFSWSRLWSRMHIV